MPPMKWRSHLSIGKAIADSLQLQQGERKAFLDGMVEPDRHGERVNGPVHSYRVSHHRPAQRIIMLHVWTARRSFLRNDTYLGFWHLGMALHYIQDKSTSKGFLGLSHERREERLAKLPVPFKAIEKGLNRYVSSPEFVKRSISRTRPKKNLQAIMVQASFRSAAVTAAVLDTGQLDRIQGDYSAARRKHAMVYVPLVIGSLAVGSSLALAWNSPFPALIIIPLVLFAMVLDRPYRRLNRLAKWNGLRRH